MSTQNNKTTYPINNVSKKQTVMIVDDHPIVCQGLEELIKRTHDLEVCRVANSASQAMEALQQSLPDLLLLDLSLPEISGLDFLVTLRSTFPELSILVLSMLDEEIYAERVLHAGAKGYVMKQEPSKMVIDAIRCVLAGDVFTSPSVLKALLQKLTTSSGAKQDLSGPEMLSERELEVYSLIGKGISTSDIAARLYLSPKTIQTYRERIKIKLEFENTIELTRSAVLWVEERA